MKENERFVTEFLFKRMIYSFLLVELISNLIGIKFYIVKS